MSPASMSLNRRLMQELWQKVSQNNSIATRKCDEDSVMKNKIGNEQ